MNILLHEYIEREKKQVKAQMGFLLNEIKSENNRDTSLNPKAYKQHCRQLLLMARGRWLVLREIETMIDMRMITHV